MILIDVFVPEKGDKFSVSVDENTPLSKLRRSLFDKAEGEYELFNAYGMRPVPLGGTVSDAGLVTGTRLFLIRFDNSQNGVMKA